MSPDGQRVIYNGPMYQAMRSNLHDIARGRCEACKFPHTVPLASGEAHHVYGRGGGKRDDRPWRPMNPNATNLLERWWLRGLIWTCHDGHPPGQKKFRPLCWTWCYHRGMVIRSE